MISCLKCISFLFSHGMLSAYYQFKVQDLSSFCLLQKMHVTLSLFDVCSKSSLHSMQFLWSQQIQPGKASLAGCSSKGEQYKLHLQMNYNWGSHSVLLLWSQGCWYQANHRLINCSLYTKSHSSSTDGYNPRKRCRSFTWQGIPSICTDCGLLCACP